MTTINLASGDSMQISETLYDFVRDEVVSASSLSVDQVFEILGDLIVQFGPKNRELLEKRDSVQSQIDSYYINKRKEGLIRCDACPVLWRIREGKTGRSLYHCRN